MYYVTLSNPNDTIPYTPQRPEADVVLGPFEGVQLTYAELRETNRGHAIAAIVTGELPWSEHWSVDGETFYSDVVVETR